MIFLFAVVLIKTWQTSRVPFIIGLSALFIVSNTCNLVQSQLTSANLDRWLSYKLLFLAITQSTLNSGHWWFCFEYLDCAYALPYKVSNEEMPKTKRRLIKLTFYGVIILQAIIPPAYCFVIFNYVRKKNVDLYYQTVRWFLTLYTI